MDQKDRFYIVAQLTVLKGAVLSDVGRAATMGCFFFTTADSRLFSLHLQSSFRIRTNDRILLANTDMFEPTESLKNSTSFDWDTYNWDQAGFNRYDAWTALYREYPQNFLIVKDVTVNPFGDLFLEYNQNMVLEVFINNSIDECWRFFEKSSQTHLVVTGQGLENE